MKLNPEEEIIFDEQYQVLIDAYGLAGDFLKTHKPEIKALVENVKDHLSGPPEVPKRVTRRETEMLQYIARGFLNKQIAAALGISEQTVKNHVYTIMLKMNCHTRAEAVVIGINRGLIKISETQ